MKIKTVFILLSFLISTKQIFASGLPNSKLKIAVLEANVIGNGISSDFIAHKMRIAAQKFTNVTVLSTDQTNAELSGAGYRKTEFQTKSGALKAGFLIGVNKVIQVEFIANTNVYKVNASIYDVASSKTERVYFNSFSRSPASLETMFDLIANELLVTYSSIDTNILVEEVSNNLPKLTKEEEIVVDKYSLQGPRLGYTFLTGSMAKLFKAPEAFGGYNCNPAFFQFGYQFEAQYLSNGDIQGLVEFIPTITGMDQSKVFPSVTLLNGLRHTRYGIEFAIGPTIYFKRIAEGYYDKDGMWHLKNDWNDKIYDPITGSYQYLENPYPIIEQADSRGDSRVASGVLIAIGKTFRSGNLNMPVNGYVVPGKYGWRFGLSFGFNLRSDAKNRIH